LKNSYKPSKTLIQYNFLVSPNENDFVLRRKINPLNPPFPISISLAHFFSFPKDFYPFFFKLTNKAFNFELYYKIPL